jgi:hypothetical protein
MNDQHRQELLRSSAAYATARLSFANAIVIAQRAGETDEAIAHVTGVHGADDPRRAPNAGLGVDGGADGRHDLLPVEAFDLAAW